MNQGVVIAYIHPGLVHNEFVKSVLGAMAYDAQNSQRIAGCVDSPGLYLPELRNALVETFLSLECEWLWFIDSDVKFPPDTLERLLSHAERPAVLAGAYWSNYGGWVNITWLKRRQSGHYRPIDKLRAGAMGVPELPAEPLELDACGMGMTLIHREVLLEVAEAHAEDDWKWFGHDLHDGRRLGEDVTFCRRAIDVGYRVLGVPVAVSHRKYVLLGPS